MILLTIKLHIWGLLKHLIKMTHFSLMVYISFYYLKKLIKPYFGITLLVQI